MRKLATIRCIDNLTPIEGADRIETAHFGGWQVVVQKGLHNIGDKVLYIEVDSCLPISNPVFSSLAERGVRTIEGNDYHRLKTIKLKRQISQGFVIPLRETGIEEVQEDFDYAESFGIIKWDPEIYNPSARLAGNALRTFPTNFFPKTNEERCQNFVHILNDNTNTYEVSLKLDGSSMTVYYNTKDEYDIGVCSRNFQLKIDDPINAENAYIVAFNKYDIGNKLKAYGRNIALQMELMGPGIQGNKEKFEEFKIFVYNIWDIDNQRYILPNERRKIVAEMGLEHVPILEENIVLSERFKTIDEMLAYAEGPSIVNKCREGLVFKSNNYVNGSVISFKAISNAFLLKNNDD